MNKEAFEIGQGCWRELIAYMRLAESVIGAVAVPETVSEHPFELHLFESAAFKARDVYGLQRLIKAGDVYSQWRIKHLGHFEEYLTEYAADGDDYAREMLEKWTQANEHYYSACDIVEEDAENLVSRVLKDGAQALEKLPDVEKSRTNLEAALRKERERKVKK